MSLVVGFALGAGLLLVVSPLLWPRTRREPRPSLPGLHDLLVQAGLERVTPATVVVVSVLLGVAGAALAYGVVRVAVLAGAAWVVASVAPWLVISWRARQRRRATRVVWPDVVDHLVSAVRSGLALPDGLMTLATAGPEALRPAFAAFAAQYRATGNLGHGLDELKSRLADPVADRILETLRMAREVGGSELTSVLRGLGAALRTDAAIRSEVEARQSWVVNAARLGLAAPWVVLVLLATRPEAAVAYNSAAGVALIVGGLVVTVVAYRVMMALGRLPEERRWFA
jgi:tight adherence protein B